MAETKPASGPRGAWARKYAAVAFLGISCALAYSITKNRRIAAESPELLPIESTLFFGEVWENRDFPWKLGLRNTTDHQLRIRSVSLSCGCGKASPTSLLIPAGETAEIDLNLDLSHAFLKPAASPVGDFEVKVALHVENESLSTYVATVRGKVKRAVSLSESLVDFGDEFIWGETPPRRSIIIRPQLPLLALLKKHREDIISVAIRRIESSPDYFELLITPHPTLHAGPFNATISLVPMVAAGQCLPETPLIVRGRVVEPVRATPDQLSFGAIRVHEKAIESLLLTSRTNDPFEVVAVQPSKSTVTITQRQGRAEFDVMIVGSTPSAICDEVRFQIRQANKLYRMCVPIVGHVYEDIRSSQPLPKD